MKKALIITSTAGFAKGFLWHDMQLLQDMGYEVHCAADAKNVTTFDPNTFFASAGVIFHQISVSPRSPLCIDNLLAAKQICDLLYKENFNFIHCHTPVVGAIVRVVGAPLRFLRKTRIVYTTHGLSFYKDGPVKDKIIFGTIEWFCGKLCDAVITINCEDYKMMHNLKGKNVYYINGIGVDTEKYRTCNINKSQYRAKIGVADEDILILSVGELSERKNHQAIIKALAELKNDRYVLVLCGKATEGKGTYDNLRDLTNRLGVRTIFLGFRQDIPEITNCADIAVLPSLREGLGLAGIEALSAGVPVIGSAVQGIKDYVIEGKTGYLCNPRDYTGLAEKIAMLSDAGVRECMKPICVRKAEEFSIQVSHKQMSDIYRELA